MSGPHDTLVELAMEQALGEVGTREAGGQNRGPVEKYIRWLGLPPGSPYCLAFALWCYNEAAKTAGLAMPLPRIAAVVRFWQAAPPWMRSAEPLLGAIFCHRDAANPAHGHAGIVVGIGDTEIKTIEGNTNPAGSREGDGIYERTRPRSYVNLGYVSARGNAPEVA